jgi:capsid protein
VTFGTPPSVGGHADYVKSVLRAIAIGYDLTYEALTGDLSNVNFSSGRMGRLDLKQIVKGYQDNLLIPQFCQPVWNWFIEACALVGEKTDGVTVEWTAPRWEYLDPVKEANGNAIQVRNGEKTLPQLIKETGRDPKQHVQEISEFNKLLDELGVQLDSDPRQKPPVQAESSEDDGEEESSTAQKEQEE